MCFDSFKSWGKARTLNRVLKICLYTYLFMLNHLKPSKELWWVIWCQTGLHKGLAIFSKTHNNKVNNIGDGSYGAPNKNEGRIIVSPK